jgi:hypothetical protein
MLEQIVSWLAYGSLAIGATSAYLHLNKLWSRKHIPEVAASISITGTLLEAIPTMVFGVYFLTRSDPVGVIDSSIWLLAAVGFIMIGSGYWVEGRRKDGLWKLALNSLRSESHEVGNLADSLLHPSSSKELVQLLQSLAEVDGEVSAEEVALVSRVAADMNVELSLQAHTVEATRTQRLLNIRSALQQYLQQSPPKQQVEKLEHLLHQLVSSDGENHADEQSSLAEVKGIIGSYLQDNADQIPFRVLLAPQSEDQLSRISSLLEGAKTHQGAGGNGITVGEFFTREYADTICREYRDLGFFCVVTDELVNES